MDRTRTPEDEALLCLSTPPFSPLTMFVCTFEATFTNINQTHEELIKTLEPRGAVKALNCNFGHKVQPGYEKFKKLPKILATPALGPRGRPAGGRPRLAPANIRVRKPQGDGTCFNSALEATIIPSPEDDPPGVVCEYFAKKPEKYYAVKTFPTTGKTQVTGVGCEGLEDGSFVARLWAKFLTEAHAAEDPAAPITVVEERPIMLNYKFHLYRRSERVILNLAAIIAYFEMVRAVDSQAPRAAEPRRQMRYHRPPFPVRGIKHIQDGQDISFKFVDPANPESSKARVNIFYRGKVNIQGAADAETPRAIYAYLSGLFSDHWAIFVSIKPLSDRARAAEKKAPSPPAGASAPPAAAENGPADGRDALSGAEICPEKGSAAGSEKDPGGVIR